MQKQQRFYIAVLCCICMIGVIAGVFYKMGWAVRTFQTSSESKPANSRSAASAASDSSGSGSSNLSAGASTGAGSTRSASVQASLPSGASLPASALPSKLTVGYYTNWSAYDGFTPEKIDVSKLNVIHYAFAGIGADLKIAVGDPSIDYSNFKKLTALKKNHTNLKLLISIGGWDGSARFSDMALTDATRKAFAQSCVAFIKKYGFDGVDIDWEYPVSGGAAGRAEDKNNFTLLMRAIRSALNTQAAADGNYYYLTFAGGASPDFIRNVQLTQLAACVDYAIDMTYDLHGPWDSYSDLNAPLYTPAEASPQYSISVDSSVRAWLGVGFPANKLVMGVPFYGYLYSGVSADNNGLYSRFASAKSIGYDSVVANYLSKGSLTYLFPNGAQVPALFGGNTFISFDDSASIARKAQYASSRGLRGLSAWELSYDRSGTLLSSVYDSLHGSK